MRYGKAALSATLLAILTVASWACTDAPPDSFGSPRHNTVPDDETLEVSTTDPATEEDEDEDETEPPEVEEEETPDAGNTDGENTPTPISCANGKIEVEPNDDPDKATRMDLLNCGEISPGDVDQFFVKGKKNEVITFRLISETKVKLQVNVVGGQTATGSGTRITGKTKPGNRKVIFRVSGATSEGQYRITLKRN